MLKKKYFKTNDNCEVTFEFVPTDATEVSLLCDATNWEPIAMKKTKEGAFRTKVRLAKDSEYQFRYLVDGNVWANDEAADAYWTNEHGSENSVVFTSQN
ncbi:MAG: isoamylase early set domain-containing protein [Ardenticatenaceae bacterium]|nr:isoamylase early set domain-containing protein [Anaerolineales bacterium]MCB8982834.1 isoamylase early set domain-containing protein [Ardenticatenaceae bacterium]